jgi:hypothetical protein
MPKLFLRLTLILSYFVFLSGCEAYNPTQGDYACFSSDAKCHEVIQNNKVILQKDN